MGCLKDVGHAIVRNRAHGLFLSIKDLPSRVPWLPGDELRGVDLVGALNGFYKARGQAALPRSDLSSEIGSRIRLTIRLQPSRSLQQKPG